MSDFFAALEATWPAAALHRAGPWLLREGAGGGKRVSAATAESDEALAAIGAMEAAQLALGQAPLVMLRAGEDALYAALADAGYVVVDPVVAMAGPVAALAGPLPPLSAFTVWPPLAVQREIWAEGGIGPARVAVMERVAGPKTSLFARTSDRPAGTGFVALEGTTAMVHALEVRPALRRQGAARHMLCAAANWAAAQGATEMCLAVTKANGAARALYASLGLADVGSYHYRTKQAQP